MPFELADIGGVQGHQIAGTGGEVAEPELAIGVAAGILAMLAVYRTFPTSPPQ